MLGRPSVNAIDIDARVTKQSTPFVPSSPADLGPTSNPPPGCLSLDMVNYSLARGIFMLLHQQTDQYAQFFLSALLALVAGGVYPSLAIIFSHLINAFAVEQAVGQDQVNFWTLMFFILALIGFISRSP
jgi:hypothetical protein